MNFAKVVTSVTILFLQIAIMALPLGVGPIPEHCEHCHISCFFLQNRFKCAAASNCISDCHHCVNKTLATISASTAHVRYLNAAASNDFLASPGALFTHTIHFSEFQEKCYNVCQQQCSLEICYVSISSNIGHNRTKVDTTYNSIQLFLHDRAYQRPWTSLLYHTEKLWWSPHAGRLKHFNLIRVSFEVILCCVDILFYLLNKIETKISKI